MPTLDDYMNDQNDPGLGFDGAEVRSPLNGTPMGIRSRSQQQMLSQLGIQGQPQRTAPVLPRLNQFPPSYIDNNSAVIRDDSTGPKAIDFQNVLKNAFGEQSPGAVNLGAGQQLPSRPQPLPPVHPGFRPGGQDTYSEPTYSAPPEFRSGSQDAVYEPMHDRIMPPSPTQAAQEAQQDLRSASGTYTAPYEPAQVQPRHPMTATPKTARPVTRTQPVDPNAGMHKVWYDKNMHRVGVGDSAPSGVAPDSFDYEPNNMTFMQRLVRGAFDTPQKAGGGPIEMAQKYASGGSPEAHSGIINMAVGGRTDHIPMNVLEGSYVLPADIVSGLGEGNTLAGAKIVDNMFKGGPFGSTPPASKASVDFPAPRYQWSMGQDQTDPYGVFKKIESPAAKNGGAIYKAVGGGLSQRGKIPIIAAGGEYVVHPEVVERLGNGDMNKGHEYLDNFVKYVRKHTVKTLNKLPPPKKN